MLSTLHETVVQHSVGKGLTFDEALEQLWDKEGSGNSWSNLLLFSRLVGSDPLWHHGLYPTSFLCSWDSPGIRIPEWVAIFFSRGSSQPRYWTHIFYIATREAHREQLIIAKTWPFFENPGQLYPCQFLCQRLLLSIVYGSLILGSQDILLSPLQLGKVTRLVLINGWWMEAGSTQGVGWSWAKIIFKTPAYINNSI